jgi:hypothetical protein
LAGCIIHPTNIAVLALYPESLVGIRPWFGNVTAKRQIGFLFRAMEARKNQSNSTLESDSLGRLLAAASWALMANHAAD